MEMFQHSLCGWGALQRSYILLLLWLRPTSRGHVDKMLSDHLMDMV